MPQAADFAHNLAGVLPLPRPPLYTTLRAFCQDDCRPAHKYTKVLEKARKYFDFWAELWYYNLAWKALPAVREPKRAEVPKWLKGLPC